MQYKKILITGGAGFVGSTVALHIRKIYPESEVIALDNLMRRGSELNLPRLKNAGVAFIHGDVRNPEDLSMSGVDLLIECSAEPSVMAGVGSSPEYLLQTNLIGAVNCFELARKNKADIIFLSTSRVYPVELLNKLMVQELPTRFELKKSQHLPGVSPKGLTEAFPLSGTRTMYGATKLSAELILTEYIHTYGIRAVINRCGLIAGPWQMGKTDQGVITYWMAHHMFNKPLTYIGFGGTGKQVRDVVHVDDIADLIGIQMNMMDKITGETFVVGGGEQNTVSLAELTDYCQKISGKTVNVTSDKKTREGDIAWYCSDNSHVVKRTGWKPKLTVRQTLTDIYTWITAHSEQLRNVLA